MEATPPRPTLLAAAKNFVRKSAGTAVLAIAPLAAVSAASSAQAQVIFNLPATGGAATHNTGGSNFFSGAGTFNASSYLGDGVQLQRSVRFISSSGVSGGMLSFQLGDFSSITNPPGINTSIDFSYDFSLTPDSGFTVSSWSLVAIFKDTELGEDSVVFASGSGTGNKTGSGTFLTPLASNDTYSVFLELYGDSPSGRSLLIQMNGLGKGVFLNATAVPEPSTYAVIFGLGALGFVMLRRSSRAAA